MTDLETRLAEAREHPYSRFSPQWVNGFDAAAAIAREVAAEKDAEIARLKQELAVERSREYHKGCFE